MRDFRPRLPAPPWLRRMLFVVCGLVILWLASSLGMRLAPPTIPSLPYDKRIDLFLAKAPELEALAVGNSLNRALDFQVLGLNGFNFYLGGINVPSTAYVLDCLLPYTPKLKYIFFTVIPSEFLRDSHYIIGVQHRFIAQSMPGWRSFFPIDGDIDNLIRGKFYSILREDNWLYVAKSFIYASKNFNTYNYDIYKNNFITIDNNGMILHYYREFNPQTYTTRITTIKNDFSKILYNKEKFFQVIKKIYVELKNKNITLVLYCPPNPDIYRNELIAHNLFQQDTWLSFRQFAMQLGIPFYDYHDNPFFSKAYPLFSDEMHLNRDGAARFSAILRRDMKLGAPQPNGVAGVHLLLPGAAD